MKFHELNTVKKTSAKRAGRGISAGRGKTAGRGTKGQSSRTGGKVKPGFEGGQSKLYKRIPKLRGFTSHARPTEAVYTGQLDQFAAGKTIDSHALAEAGLISSPYAKTKLIVKGELTKKHTVKLQAASEAALAMVQKAGGSFEQTDRLMRPSTSKSDKKTNGK